MDDDKYLTDESGYSHNADNYQIGKRLEVEEGGTFGGYRYTYEVMINENGDKYWKLIKQEKSYDSR
jgi:hypothetical protein